MKKILSLLLIFFISAASAYAKDKNVHSIKYNGNTYYLMYSVGNKESGGYLNEYYKLGENYYNWSEMVAIHSFPNVYSPVDQIRMFKDYLTEKNCQSTITFDDKKGSALIDFVMINNKNIPNILEFNVFKYQKIQKEGTVAIQYTKRYTATTALQVEAAKKDFAKGRKNALDEVKAYKIPPVVTEEYDKYKLANSEADDTKDTKDTKDIKNKEIKEVPPPIVENTENKPEISTTDAIENQDEIRTQDEIAAPKDEKTTEIEMEESVIAEEEVSLDSAPCEIELIQKQPGYDKDILPIKSKKKQKTEALKQTQEEYAPTPESDKINKKKEKAVKEKQNKKSKSKKKNKEEAYQVINSKDDFYAKPVKRKNISPKKAAKLKAKENAKKSKDNL